MKCWHCQEEYVAIRDYPPKNIKHSTACIKCLRFPLGGNKEFTEKKRLDKQRKGGLRKCPGHKKLYPEYNESGQCNICGGYKYQSVV